MKSNLDKLYKTDSNLEKDGIWFDIDENVGFKIKRLGGKNSTEVKKAHAKHYKPFARQIKTGTLSSEKELEISIKTFVESSVVDWKGIEIDAEPKEFSKEQCEKLLIQLPELANTLIEYATSYEYFKEDLGNS